MLTYNSQLKKLVLPEYGRNIQQMVDHCLTIEDRDERTHCAYTIVQNMANMFPQLRAETDYQHKLWDHLMIMSGFKLDVDFPFDDIIREESLDTKPDPITYELEPIQYRHYGKNIERMIERAATYPEGEERDALVMLLANHMIVLQTMKTFQKFSTRLRKFDLHRIVVRMSTLSYCPKGINVC